VSIGGSYRVGKSLDQLAHSRENEIIAVDTELYAGVREDTIILQLVMLC